jgi:hypothetical protein
MGCLAFVPWQVKKTVTPSPSFCHPGPSFCHPERNEGSPGRDASLTLGMTWLAIFRTAPSWSVLQEVVTLIDSAVSGLFMGMSRIRSTWQVKRTVTPSLAFHGTPRAITRCLLKKCLAYARYDSAGDFWTSLINSWQKVEILLEKMWQNPQQCLSCICTICGKGEQWFANIVAVWLFWLELEERCSGAARNAAQDSLWKKWKKP